MKIKLGQLMNKPTVRWHIEGYTIEGVIVDFVTELQETDEFAMITWAGTLETTDGKRYMVDSSMDIEPVHLWPIKS